MEFIYHLQQNPHLLFIFISIMGLAIGSFLNVVIYRLPIILFRDWQAEAREHLNLHSVPESAETFNLLSPGSHCPQCHHRIRAWENIPVLSYLFLRGKCRVCHKTISIRYPFIELITALLSTYIAWYFGLSYQMIATLLLTWGLICLTMIDLDHQILPDTLTLALLWLGLLLNVNHLYVSIHEAIYGAILAYCSLWLFTKLFYLVTGKIGMGHGDFKLFAMLGAWLGYQALLPIIMIASLSALTISLILIVLKKQTFAKPVSFGPYLAFAGWITLFWGKPITQFYFQFFGVR